MKKFRLVVVLSLVVILLTIAIPVQAITDGGTDGDGHPQVGMMFADDNGDGWGWVCSGTLLSPTVYLTAGHCTDGANFVIVMFNSDLNTSWAGYITGTAYTPANYSFPSFDVGVVVLDEPVYLPEGYDYGVLPAADSLNTLKTKRGKQDTTFTAVGYGMQASFPDAAGWKNQHDLIRMVAYPKLIQINVPGFTGDFSLLLSNNANTGGTCFGDSGGPNFLGDSNIIAGVTSFGINGNCAGTGGVFRMDQAEVIEWVEFFLE